MRELDGYGTPKQIAERLKELKQSACGITDHGNIFGHLEFAHEMKENGIKPILGCEFYLVNDMHKKAEEIEEEIVNVKGVTVTKKRKVYNRKERAHITITARNSVGYKNLLKLSHLSYNEGFYYKPRIDFKTIIQYQEGLNVMSGCLLGLLSKQIIAGYDDVAFKWVQYLKQRIEHFNVEIIPCPSLPESIKAINTLWRIGEELKVPLVITSDAHFPRPEDWEAEDAMVCVSMHKKKNDIDRIQLPEYHYICSADEMFARTRQCLHESIPDEAIWEAMDRSVQITNETDVELPKSKGPMFQIPEGKTDARSVLIEWIEEGKKYRESLGTLPKAGSPERDKYDVREAREMAILDYHSFHNYFCIVGEIVRWCKQEKILCIARGSAGGSLICYYLGITQIDPVKYDLPIERFIDETRPDAPDIDLDLDARFRHRVFEMLVAKYGEERCAQIAALSYYRGRAAVRDIGGVFDLPIPVINKLAELIPQSLDADEGTKVDNILERVFEQVPEIIEILQKYPQFKLAANIEGQIRQYTKHAAGFIVDANNLDEIVGLLHLPGELPLVQCDKDYAAKQGLLKIDALNVDMLTILAESLEMIGKDPDWLFGLPEDDKDTFAMIGEGKSTGVFQLQGPAATKQLKNIKPKDFEDFYVVSALARPGPLQSGGAEEFANRRFGRSAMPKYHPAIMQIVSRTNGIILYQEQVMAVARELGGIDWKHVHKIRKFITARAGANKVDAYYPEFLKHATEVLGIPAAQAEHIWEQCKKAGNYVFNKAHVAAYGKIGYWSAYLKTHYPAIFTCTACKYQASGDKGRAMRQKLLRDFQDTGGDFILLDYNRSGISFKALDSTTIIGGFQDLEGVGPVISTQLLEGQPYDSWDSFFSKCKKNVREKLVATGIHTGELNYDAITRVAPWYIKVNFTERERLFFERMHCTDIGSVFDAIENREVLDSVRFGGKVTALQIIDIRKEAKKYNRPMPKEGDPYYRAVATISDMTGSVEISYNAWKWQEIMRTRHPEQGSRGDGIGNGVYVVAKISKDKTRFYGEDMLVVQPSQ